MRVSLQCNPVSTPETALLDTVDLVFVPIYNIDGHERMSRWNFLGLRGPAEKGYVGNARNINLNRDYAKVDAPETRAMVALLRRLDPILYIDCHVSDGFDMQYDTTFTYAGWSIATAWSAAAAGAEMGAQIGAWGFAAGPVVGAVTTLLGSIIGSGVGYWVGSEAVNGLH